MAEVREDRFYVYRHTFPDGSIYIGKGTGVRAHSYGDGRRGKLWVNTKNKYGRPKSEFLKKEITEELAYFIEAETIDILSGRGYKMRNMAPGGEGTQSGMIGELSPNFGRRHTKEWIKNMSERNSGESNPHYGFSHSEKTKAKISETTKATWHKNKEKMRLINKGRKHTPEHNAKIGAALRAMSAESREIIRQKVTGKKRSPEQIENYKRAAAKRIGTEMPESAKKKMSESQWQKDRTIHVFEGPNGDAFSGMRSEFRKKFGFSVNDLFRKDKRRRPHVKGWRLKGHE